MKDDEPWVIIFEKDSLRDRREAVRTTGIVNRVRCEEEEVYTKV